MKKRFISLLLMATLLLSTTSLVFADDYIDDIPDNAHKIRNKWDAAGSFTSQRDLSTPLVGRTWTYELHIKEAMYGPYSKGVILFVSGDDVITAHVKDVKTNYHYWTRTNNAYIKDNLAAVGWADYDGATYYFMFLHSEGAIWIILSNTPYDVPWNAGSVWTTGRAYQVLSSPFIPNVSIFDLDPKDIHGD